MAGVNFVTYGGMIKKLIVQEEKSFVFKHKSKFPSLIVPL